MKNGYLYEFGVFRLDIAEHVLTRIDGPINGELPEKAFQALCYLVQKNGHLLTKKELIDHVWPDAFVEENNLDKCIHAIRRVLGEKSSEQKYIQTVRKHGYRFVAPVRCITPENFVTAGKAPSSIGSNGSAPRTEGSDLTDRKGIKKDRFRLIALVTSAVLLCAIGLGSWLASGIQTQLDAPILSTGFTAERLSSNGKVFYTVISPDGKNVVYTNIVANEKQSVWLRNIDTGSNVEIIPPSDSMYFGLALSPDGNFLYFARRPRNVEGEASIYRQSIVGGIPETIIANSQGWMSLSPDGNKISFIRCRYKPNDFCSLWMADASNGSNEIELVSKSAPIRIGDNRFSPDGKLIAFATGHSETGANEYHLSAVDVLSKEIHDLTSEVFFHIRSLTWLPDQKGLLVTAARIPNKNFLIWKISTVTGKAEPLTNDSESYSNLSIDKTASVLVSTQFKENFRLQVFEFKDSSETLVLPNTSSATFATGGRIIFTSRVSGNDEIWSVGPNGEGQKQLTNDPGDDRRPVAAPDNSAIYFASNRSGAMHVWRMNIDGSNPSQLTRQTGGFPRFLMPGGEWLYYQNSVDKTLWRVATTSGEEQVVLNRPASSFAFSPDGKLFSFAGRTGNAKRVIVSSLTDAQTDVTYKYAADGGTLVDIAWLPDGKGFVYILSRGEFRKNSIWLQALNAAQPPRRLADLDDDELSGGGGLAISPDGKTYTVSSGGWRHDAVLFKGLK